MFISPRESAKGVLYTFPSESKSFFIFFQQGDHKNMSCISNVAIRGRAAACSVAVRVALLGTAAVSGAVLAFKRR